MNNPFLHTLWQTVAGVLVPESLAVDSARQKASRRGVFELVAPRAAVLRPGDLIVVRTPGTFYRLVRSAANHKVDHLAIVMENGMFLHVGPPVIRLLPVELLLTPNRRPRVFRPKLTPAELESLLRSLRTLLGQPYDSVRVYSFIARLALSSYFGARFPFVAPHVKALTGAANPDGYPKDLVYDAHSKVPLASGSWKPPSTSDSTAAAASSSPSSQPPRATRSGRIVTVGGRNAEDDIAPSLDASPFAASASLPSSPLGNDDEIPGISAPASSEATICTDAILPRLLAASAEWRAALGFSSGIGNLSSSSSPVASSLSTGAAALRKKLDVFHLRSWSINDVFNFSALRPDLLQRVRLPPVVMPEGFKDLEDAEKQAASDVTDEMFPFASNRDGANRTTSVPLFSTAAYRKLDAFLAARYPALHSRSVHAEALLRQVYETASPLYRSLVQLYAYTMKRLPVRVQMAIRLYLLILTLRQLLHLWRGYVLVRGGVRVVRGVLTAPLVRSVSRRQQRKAAAATAARQTKSSIFTRRRSRSRSRSKSRSRSRSPAVAKAAVKSKLAAKSLELATEQIQLSAKQAVNTAAAKQLSSSSPRKRSRSPAAAADKLERMLAHPSTHRVASLLADQIMPERHAAVALIKEVMNEVAAAKEGRASPLLQKAQDVATSAASALSTASSSFSTTASLPAPTLRTLVTDTLLDVAAVGTPSSSAAPSSATRGRKRAALKSLAKTSAAIAFPRASRLVRFAQDTVGATTASALSKSATTSSSAKSADHKDTSSSSPTRSRSPSPASSSSSSPSPTRRALSPRTSRAVRFASQHPHLAGVFEQGKLLLVSALAVQFVDQLRSAL